MDLSFLDRRPIIVAIAGSNGAGKSTFYHAHFAETDLRSINADDLAAELKIDPYEAAEVATALREALLVRRESFLFETVFSDPVGDKVDFLCRAVDAGYEVALLFVRIADVRMSIQRVSMRAAQGGHDVPDDKLRSRFARTAANLDRAIHRLPHVLVFDNSHLASPFRLVEAYQDGAPVDLD